MKMDIGIRYVFLYLAAMLGFLILVRTYDADKFLASGLGAFGALSYTLATLIGRKIESYLPTSLADAKICNERIKFVASLFNAVAIVLVAGGFAKPIIEQDFEVFEIQNIVVVAVGIVFHAGGHRVLAMMKDESKFASAE